MLKTDRAIRFGPLVQRALLSEHTFFGDLDKTANFLMVGWGGVGRSRFHKVDWKYYPNELHGAQVQTLVQTNNDYDPNSVMFRFFPEDYGFIEPGDTGGPVIENHTGLVAGLIYRTDRYPGDASLFPRIKLFGCNLSVIYSEAVV